MYNSIVKFVKKYEECKNDTNMEKTRRKKAITTTERNLREIYMQIQNTIYGVIDNKLVQTKASSHLRKIRSIKQRLEGKSGRIVQNIVGKRSDFTARTVVTCGGPEYRMNELGVPRHIAENQTKPIIVCEGKTPNSLNNVEYCQKLVNEGKVNFVLREGKIYNCKFQKNMILRHGDTIERKLQNGDLIIFNRQPTLRKESMMTFKVVVKNNDSKSFGVPLAVVTPFNAD